MPAEVIIENKDIGFVSVGDTAEVKIDTFNYTKYGLIEASVKRISQDAVTDEKRGVIFPAIVELSTNKMNIDGKDIVLTPGMTLTAEIKIGQRRVIEYLLSPVKKAVHESMREK